MVTKIKYFKTVFFVSPLHCTTMSDLITGSCNCGRHSFSIPKPTEMNLCRACSLQTSPYYKALTKR